MGANEIIFVVLLVGGLLGSASLTRRWFLFGTFLVFFVCFGLMEWWSVSATGMSISQDFWKYSETNKFGAWLVIGGMFVGWMALLYHFSFKHLLRKK